MTTLSLVLLSLTVAAGVARTIRPGSLADRVIGLDVALLALVGLVAVHATTDDQPWLLDVLPLIGLLAVVGTLTFARVVEARR